MKGRDVWILAGAVALTDSAVKGFIRKPPAKNYGFAGNRFDKFPRAVACVSAALTGMIAVSMVLFPERSGVPAALVLGGALSNTADRLVRGYVVDYIPLPKKYYANISDLAIFAGTGLMAADVLKQQTKAPDDGRQII